MIKNNSHILYGNKVPFSKTHRSFLERCDFFMNKTELGSLFNIFIGVCRN